MSFLVAIIYFVFCLACADLQSFLDGCLDPTDTDIIDITKYMCLLVENCAIC
jgi:hypothetical protein